MRLKYICKVIFQHNVKKLHFDLFFFLKKILKNYFVWLVRPEFLFEKRIQCIACTYVYLLTYLVEVERKVTGDRAIETRFEEGRPPVTETMRSAPIVFTDSRDARVHSLRMRKLRLVNCKKRKAR